MKIVFMGTPDFAVPILEALATKYEVSLVVSQPNRIKKKGQFIMTPVAECANRLGIKVFQPENISLEYEEILAQKADVLVTAAYGQYVPSKILNSFKKTINVHGSLLPFYRGGAPIQRAIMNGEKTTGITIIEMAKKLDAGKMYGKKEYKILETDTSSKVFNDLSLIGRDLLMELIEDIYNEKNTGVVQDESLATYAPNLKPEEEFIDFNKPAFLVSRHINSLTNEPGATIRFNGMNIKLYGSNVVEDDTNLEPGTILSLKKQVLIKCSDKAVSIQNLLIPGKKVLSAKDFVNGQKIFKEFDVI